VHRADQLRRLDRFAQVRPNRLPGLSCGPRLRTMPERLAKVGDLFAQVFGEKATLPGLK